MRERQRKARQSEGWADGDSQGRVKKGMGSQKAPLGMGWRSRDLEDEKEGATESSGGSGIQAVDVQRPWGSKGWACWRSRKRGTWLEC